MNIIDSVYSGRTFASPLHLFDTFEEIGLFVKEVVNVNMTHATDDLIHIKPYAGNSLVNTKIFKVNEPSRSL